VPDLASERPPSRKKGNPPASPQIACARANGSSGAKERRARDAQVAFPPSAELVRYVMVPPELSRPIARSRVTTPPGVVDGTRMRLKEAGRQGPRPDLNGDLRSLPGCT